MNIPGSTELHLTVELEYVLGRIPTCSHELSVRDVEANTDGEGSPLASTERLCRTRGCQQDRDRITT